MSLDTQVNFVASSYDKLNLFVLIFSMNDVFQGKEFDGLTLVY
jgi:hypothetical protein